MPTAFNSSRHIRINAMAPATGNILSVFFHKYAEM